MQLVIAEKPSVGRAIAQAISENPEKQDGYIDCGTVDGTETYVSWAQGHLVDLADPKEYGEKWKTWSLETLPVDPGDEWKWEVSHEKGADKRYRALLPLMEKATLLIDACDPDREGEGIFTRIIRQAGLAGRQQARLWTNSMDADGIRAAWKDIRAEETYHGLAAASDARAKADWITGMTASRAYSLLYNRRCSIGRVETPTLAMIVERDRQIAGHVSTPYWTVSIPMGGWTLTSERIDDEARARQAAENMPRTVTIGRVERKKTSQHAPRLYSLTDLQRDANTQRGLTAGQTLDGLQSLYEQGLATYPRTDSRYITTDDTDSLAALLASPEMRDPRHIAGGATPDPSKADPARTADNKRVEGHTALLPTSKLDQTAYERLDDRERQIIDLIITRMWQATGPDREHETTKAGATIDGIDYTASQDRTITPGWTVYKADPDKKDDHQQIPDNLADGTTVPVTGEPDVAEGHTRPPKPYTDASLLTAMEHAGRLIDDKTLRAAIDDDSTHAAGLGTPATRAGIIDKLIAKKYADRRGKKIVSAKAGRDLIAIVAPGLRSVEATARMEQGLAGIADGTTDEEQWLGQIHEQARHILPDAQDAFDPAYKKEDEQNREEESYGPCPVCGKPVIKTRSGYWKCSANRSVKKDGRWEHKPGSCTYGIWKKTVGNNKKRLTDSLVRKTLAGKKPRVRGAFHSARTGQDYDMILVPDTKWGIDTKFPQRSDR